MLNYQTVDFLKSQLREQYDRSGYSYEKPGDVDRILEAQAAKLAASGVSSIYDIGLKEIPNQSTINDVFRIGNDYYYYEQPDEGAGYNVKIDPSRIIDLAPDTPRREETEGGQPIFQDRFKVTVAEDPTKYLINKQTGQEIPKVSLKSNWKEDPSAFKIGKPEPIVSRNSYERYGFDTSVEGQADYSVQFVDGNPIFLPAYKSTKTDLTPYLAMAALVAAPYVLGTTAAAPAAAGTSTTAGLGGGTGLTMGAGGSTGLTLGTTSTGIGGGAIGTGLTAPAGFTLAPGVGASLAAGGAGLSLLEGAQFPVEGLQATASNVPSTAAPFATTTAAEGLAIPTTPGLSAMGGAQGLTIPVAGGTISQLGLVPTGAVPALGTDGLFSTSLVNDPNVLGNAVFGTDALALPAAASGGIGAMNALQAAALANTIFNPPKLPQQGLLGGRTQSQFSLPTPEPRMVGLLPIAERYRRSLI